MKRFFVVSGLALALAGCGTVGSKLNDVLDSARDQAAEETAAALNSYCDIRGGNVVSRKRYVDAVNAHNAAAGKKAKATAQDCDGDGKPDF